MESKLVLYLLNSLNTEQIERMSAKGVKFEVEDGKIVGYLLPEE